MVLGLPAIVANAAVAPVGQGFTVTPSDLAFILKQIKIAETHVANTTSATGPCGALVGTGPNQIPDALSSYGLRTVDGSCNNLIPGRENFGAADQPFPRHVTPVFRAAEDVPTGFGPPGPTSYAQKKGLVFDSQPRVISNLIDDQTSTNPAAVAAAAFPVRTQGDPGLFPCTTDPNPLATPTPTAGVPAGCVPSHQTLFIPNVTTDVGLSPPYNSLFTFFGQFFDHGVDQTVKSGGTVFVPLHADDPLIPGPDHILGNADDLPPQLRFMVLTRAQNQPGPDGILGDNPATAVDESADNIQNANNTDSPWVDQSQTYTSHSSHQVFLREYVNNTGADGIAGNADDRPVSTGMLLGGQGTKATGMATWASVKAQAATLLGLRLVDKDVTNITMIAADAYGKFIPGALRGLPQYVTATVKTSDNSIPLLTAFLNPPEYFNGGPAGDLNPEQAAGSVVMGSSDQVGNELDEFVTETLRNNLLGLPLDLPTLNLTRARDAGIPPLNDVRRQIFAATNDGQLKPYTSWSDYGQHLKHPESLINFVAAYGKHPSITGATTLVAKRDAARAIVDPRPANPTAVPPITADVPPADAADFMFGTGAWASTAAGVTTTGLDDVDLWVGGLAEITNLFGGLLGSTFNYVFENQLTDLQNGDRPAEPADRPAERGPTVLPGPHPQHEPAGPARGQLVRRADPAQHRRHEHAEGRRVRHCRLQVPAQQPGWDARRLHGLRRHRGRRSDHNGLRRVQAPAA